MTPSHKKAAEPSGETSHSRTIQSVSRAEVAANSLASIGPITSTFSVSSGVV